MHTGCGCVCVLRRTRSVLTPRAGLYGATGVCASREHHQRDVGSLYTCASARTRGRWHNMLTQLLSGVQIDPGELNFCAGVSYTACLRYPSAAAYDDIVFKARQPRSRKRLQKCCLTQDEQAYTDRAARLALEFPLVSPECIDAFQARHFCLLDRHAAAHLTRPKQSYICTLSFPQCITDPGGSGSLVERPICYSYCMSAEMACGSNSKLAAATCAKAVAVRFMQCAYHTASDPTA